MAEIKYYPPTVADTFQVTAYFGMQDKSLWANGHTGVDYVGFDYIYPTSEDQYNAHYGYTNARGRYIETTDQSGVKHLYCHLESVSNNLSGILAVDKPIGKMGSTGHVTGKHLHYQMNDQYGALIDPSIMLEHPNQLGTFINTRPKEITVNRVRVYDGCGGPYLGTPYTEWNKELLLKRVLEGTVVLYKDKNMILVYEVRSAHEVVSIEALEGLFSTMKAGDYMVGV